MNETRMSPASGNGLAPRRPARGVVHPRAPSPNPDSGDPIRELVHDLRSPLASLVILSDALVRGTNGKVSDLQRRQLILMQDASLGLAAVLSDAAELNEALYPPEEASSPFCVDEVLQSVADVIRPQAESKGLVVLTQAPAGDRRVGHRPALRRVLLNLATNAVKFTDEGHVEIVATTRADGRLSLCVRDSGGGLPPAVTEFLSRPVDAPRFDFGATHMGLTICRRLLRSMGSGLQWETSPGRGTRFHFALDLPSPPLA